MENLNIKIVGLSEGGAKVIGKMMAAGVHWESRENLANRFVRLSEGDEKVIGKMMAAGVHWESRENLAKRLTGRKSWSNST